ncbi:3-oxoacyl-ACP reductase FabG [soil metagenome]
MNDEPAAREVDLSGHVSLVTGAGAGVGWATAVQLGMHQARVALVGRTLKPLEETAGLVRGAGGEALIAQADVGDERAIGDAVDAAATHFNRLDSLVLAAGTGIFGRAENYTLAAWRTTIETNLTGPFLCCRAAIPHLRNAGGGSVVAISSGAAKQGYAGLSAYSASKFGLMGLMQSLAAELGEDRIRISSVVPGSILTEFGGRSIEEKLALRNDGRKYLEPDDVARAVVYLLKTPEGAWTQEMTIWPV